MSLMDGGPFNFIVFLLCLVLDILTLKSSWDCLVISISLGVNSPFADLCPVVPHAWFPGWSSLLCFFKTPCLPSDFSLPPESPSSNPFASALPLGLRPLSKQISIRTPNTIQWPWLRVAAMGILVRKGETVRQRPSLVQSISKSCQAHWHFSAGAHSYSWEGASAALGSWLCLSYEKWTGGATG